MTSHLIAYGEIEERGSRRAAARPFTDKEFDMYDGEITPGGPSAVRELPRLTIRKASVGRMDNNVYLLTCVRTEAQLLIDAADDPERIESLIDEGSGRLDGIVTTHQHWDHTRALADVAGWTGAPTYAGTRDADALPVEVTTPLNHADTLSFGEITLRIIGLRGHTPGGIALAYKDSDDPDGVAHLFVGDSLFPGGPGKTTHAEDFTQLMDDLESKVFDAYGDDTVIYPGHGADTTLGAERPHLTEWRARGW